MNFFIKQNSTLPLLKIKISKDGRSDFQSFINDITNSSLFFSLTDVDTNVPRVLNRPLTSLVNESPNGVSPSEVYFYIQLSFGDTKKTGKFKLSILIENSSGKISLPLKEDIFVYITESFVLDGFTFSDKYIVDNPCCYSPIDRNNYLVTQDGRKIKTQNGFFIVVIV
jgi:hypothetical protein